MVLSCARGPYNVGPAMLVSPLPWRVVEGMGQDVRISQDYHLEI